MTSMPGELKGPRPLLEDSAVPLLCPHSLLATPREGAHSNGTFKRCAVRIIDDFEHVLSMQVSLLQASLTSQFKKALADLDIAIPPHVDNGDVKGVHLGDKCIALLPKVAEAGEHNSIAEYICSDGTNLYEKKHLDSIEHRRSNIDSTEQGPRNERRINKMLRGDTLPTEGPDGISSTQSGIEAETDGDNKSDPTMSHSNSGPRKAEPGKSRRSKYLVGCAGAVAAGVADVHEAAMKRWSSIIQRVTEFNGIADRFDDDDDTMAFEFHPDWSNKDPRKVNTTLLASLRIMGDAQRSASRVSLTDGVKFDDVVKENSCLQWFAIRPHSFQRLFWGLLGALLILYDLLTLPLILTFQIQQPPALKLMEYAAFVYWSLDLLMNFFLGFMKDGLLEMRIKQIVVNYARTWLVADLLIVFMDVLLFFFDSLDSASSALRVTKGLKAMRMLRLLRLVRLVRMRKLIDVLNVFWHDIRSDYNKLVLRLARNLFSIMILNHYIACMWYGIAEMSERDDSWVHNYQLDEHGVVFRYAMSMHWTLCQFTPATNNVHPGNVIERVFACFLVIFALVAFSSFVSGITNAVSQLRSINQDKLNENAKIRAFISDRKLSYRLGNQILTFFDANYGRAHRPHENEIKFLNEVPQSMMLRLHEEVYHPILMTNWMFYAFLNVNPEFWKKICHYAVTEKTYASQQDVFISNTQCERIYCLESGTLRYISDTDESDIDKGGWLSEMSLWVKWIHSGQVAAASTCEILEIDCNSFRQLALHRGGTILSCLKKFAIFVVGYAEKICGEEDDDNAISDLPLPQHILKDLGIRILKLHRMDVDELLCERPSNGNGFLNLVKR